MLHYKSYGKVAALMTCVKLSKSGKNVYSKFFKINLKSSKLFYFEDCKCHRLVLSVKANVQSFQSVHCFLFTGQIAWWYRIEEDDLRKTKPLNLNQKIWKQFKWKILAFCWKTSFQEVKVMIRQKKGITSIRSPYIDEFIWHVHTHKHTNP